MSNGGSIVYPQGKTPNEKKRTFEGMIAAIRSCLTSLRTGDQKIWWRIKSKVKQHWDLIIAAVKCLDAKAMVFRFGKHEMCPARSTSNFGDIPNVLFVPR